MRVWGNAYRICNRYHSFTLVKTDVFREKIENHGVANNMIRNNKICCYYPKIPVTLKLFIPYINLITFNQIHIQFLTHYNPVLFSIPVVTSTKKLENDNECNELIKIQNKRKCIKWEREKINWIGNWHLRVERIALRTMCSSYVHF